LKPTATRNSETLPTFERGSVKELTEKARKIPATFNPWKKKKKREQTKTNRYL